MFLLANDLSRESLNAMIKYTMFLLLNVYQINYLILKFYSFSFVKKKQAKNDHKKPISLIITPTLKNLWTNNKF